jgi:hypothetical protein
MTSVAFAAQSDLVFLVVGCTLAGGFVVAIVTWAAVALYREKAGFHLGMANALACKPATELDKPVVPNKEAHPILTQPKSQPDWKQVVRGKLPWPARRGQLA